MILISYEEYHKETDETFIVRKWIDSAQVKQWLASEGMTSTRDGHLIVRRNVTHKTPSEAMQELSDDEIRYFFSCIGKLFAEMEHFGLHEESEHYRNAMKQYAKIYSKFM